MLTCSFGSVAGTPLILLNNMGADWLAGILTSMQG